MPVISYDYFKNKNECNNIARRRLETADDQAIITYLQRRNELIVTFNKLISSKDCDWDGKTRLKYKNEFTILNIIIQTYLKRKTSESLFPIICTKKEIVIPQKKCELETNIRDFNLEDAEVFFTVPESGYIHFSYDSTENGTIFFMKNDIPHYNRSNACSFIHRHPKIKKSVTGSFIVEEGATLGIAKSNNKKLVRVINNK